MSPSDNERGASRLITIKSKDNKYRVTQRGRMDRLLFARAIEAGDSMADEKIKRWMNSWLAEARLAVNEFMGLDD